jgi:EAL and modified HD-GYP domain-containing signal transduction protein
MWPSFLLQLLGRAPAALKSRAPASTPAPKERRKAGSAVRPTTQADTPQTIIGARRPLVAADGSMAGFEFHVSPVLMQRLRREADHPAAHGMVSSVLGAMRLSLAPGRMALADLPAPWLAATPDDGSFAPGMWLVTGPDAGAALVGRLRGQGVRVGWRPAEVPAGMQPDFLLVPAAQALQVAAGWPGAPLLVLDAPDIDSMESLLHAPVTLVACSPRAAMEPTQAQALSPQVQRLMSLLARLVRDEDHGALVAEIKADAALALRLLQYMNSAGATPGRVLGSIDDAVMVLGRDALYRWCAQLLVRLGPSRPAAAALQALALARARFFEQLARTQGEPAPGRLYLLGLASLLPQLLRSSVADALAALQLPAEAHLALSEGTGPWASYVALVHALERPDLEAARPLAVDFGGLPSVMAASARSWA